MKKAVLSNRIYLHVDKELKTKLREELLYTIDRMPVSEFPEIIQNYTNITDSTGSIPSGREDLIPEGYVIVDKRVLPKADFPAPRFTLRDSQADAVDLIDNGIVLAKPGFGKTIVGLGIACKLGTKTLVITTTTAIRDMWIAEVKIHLGIDAGIIGSGKFETDSPIVIANIQTLRNRVEEVKAMFGLVIVDEVHRSVAHTFTHVLNNMRPTYRVGLSGTIQRKDGKHVVLQDYFGKKQFVASIENTVDPEVHVYKHKHELNMNEFTPWANVLTKLIENKEYQDYVVSLAKLYASQGHKVLVISSRTDLLEYGHSQTPDNSLIVTGKVVGAEVRQKIFDAMAKEKDAQILWGAQTIFSEGVSINPLSCVILGTPINNDPLLEQIAGRIMRIAEGKQQPVVVDINLAGNTGHSHANARKKFYINMGWKIKGF